jgi:hypothetical protein
MNEPYATIIDCLRSRSICTYLQSPDQLVVSRQRRPVLPSGSNSFWLSHQRGRWYLCTWAANCYALPPESDLVGLCEEFLDYASCAQSQVPPRLVDRFELTKLSHHEFEDIFG